MNEQSQNQLFIFRKKRSRREGYYDSFLQHKRIVVREIPIFNKVTMTYYFKNTTEGLPDSLIFVKQDVIFELNYETEEITIVHKFKERLKKQPEFFIMDSAQSKYVVISGSDCLWYDKENDREEDLDEMYNIDLVKQLVYDDEEEVFFILCNK